MRAMIIAGALGALTAASAANAAEPAACYDAAVIGTLTAHANDRLIDSLPVPSGRILPRVEADMLVNNWSQLAGAPLPKSFWARTVVTAAPDPNTTFVVYLKTQPDGVPLVVGSRFAPLFWRTSLPDYPAC